MKLILNKLPVKEKIERLANPGSGVSADLM
jgi:hypothetical protein